MKTEELFLFDKKLCEKGIIAGVDEAGRGPLAGPVSAGAAIMNLNADIIDGINDSKKLSEKKREELYSLITQNALAYSVCMIDNKVIDEINILEATKLAMKTAISDLKVKPDLVLIDAVKLDVGIPVMPIIKGDATSYNIAAASILAKVERDRLMAKFAKEYPEYGFEKHKGYGTAAHIEAIRLHGASPIHRVTFIRKFL